VIFTVELRAAINDAGDEQSFYFSTDAFQSGPNDTPADINFSPRLSDPGDIGLFVFADGRTSGGSALEAGDIVLINTDGGLDEMGGFSFDGRPVVVRAGLAGQSYDSFTPVLVGTAGVAFGDYETLTIRLRDAAAIFDRTVQSRRYAGTNVLPDGFEGTPDDIMGQLKPLLIGGARNFAPPCVNTSKLVYQVSYLAISDVTAVYIDGAAWTRGSNYPTKEQLAAAALVPGSLTYATCFAEGMFRLSDAPEGTVTCDAHAGTILSARTIAACLRTLIILASNFERSDPEPVPALSSGPAVLTAFGSGGFAARSP